MTAYTQYFNKFLNGFNLLGGRSMRPGSSAGTAVGHKLSRQAGVQLQPVGMRAFDNGLEATLPLVKNDSLVEEITIPHYVMEKEL